ncbi:MAG: rhomboid family intramembrane serine protease [Actinomycetales bacterium]|nr:rhomboid family intramembrane serine protease [Actinomycetales bacterium]
MSDAPPYGEVQAPAACYRHPNRPTRVRCQRCDRPICASCQTPAAVGVQCPECVRQGRAAQTGGSRVPGVLRAFAPGRSNLPVVTYVLMALCILAYGAQFLTGQALTNAWVMAPWRIVGEPWRLMTAAFLHSPASLLHLLFNMYALFIFGPALESFLGRWRYLAVYLITAFGGNVASVVLYEADVLATGGHPELVGGFFAIAPSLGASGAIFGLMGAILVLRRAMGVRGMQLLIVLGLNLVITFFVPSISWTAHLGGLLIGAALGAILLRMRRPEQTRARVLALAGVALALAAVCVLCVLLSPNAYV